MSFCKRCALQPRGLSKEAEANRDLSGIHQSLWSQSGSRAAGGSDTDTSRLVFVLNSRKNNDILEFAS